MANGENWRVDKRIQVADILAMLVIAMMLTGWVFAVSARVTENHESILKHEEVMDVYIEAIKDQYRLIRADQDNNYQEILSRLSRIEDSVNDHRAGTGHAQ